MWNNFYFYLSVFITTLIVGSVMDELMKIKVCRRNRGKSND